MTLELAEKVQSLMNEREDLIFLRHGAYKAMEPKCVTEERIATYNKRITEIEKVIEVL